jgi:acyl carrier protein
MAKTISSRTPEGRPGRCPVCGTILCIEPSSPAGDAPCPACGHLLWFVILPDQTLFYSQNEVSPQRWQRFVAVLKRVSDLLLDMPPDSLDIVELVMELEGEFKISIPQGETERIKSIGDLIDFFLHEEPKGE